MGHQSYVSAVAFDPYTTVLPEVVSSNVATSLTMVAGEGEKAGEKGETPSIRGSFRLSGGAGFDVSSVASSPFLGRLASEAGDKEVVAYRLGSVGQDSQLCLWDLSEDALKIRRPFGRSRSRPSRMVSTQPQQHLHSAESLSVKQRGNGGQETTTNSEEKGGEKLVLRPRSDALIQETAQEKPANSPSQDSTSSNQIVAGNMHSTTNEQSPKNPSTTVTHTNTPQTSNGEKEQKRKSGSQARGESVEKDASTGTSDPDVSTDDKSSHQSRSKNEKKSKSKGGKEGKKVHIRGQQKSLRDPMKRVMKFVGIGGQHHHNGRREVSAFETCNSDDIAPKMEEVNVIEPLVAEKVDRERLSDLVFRDDCIVVASYDGYISLWARPGVEAGGGEGGGGEGGGGESEGGETPVPSQQSSDDVTSDKPPDTHPGVSIDSSFRHCV